MSSTSPRPDFEAVQENVHRAERARSAYLGQLVAEGGGALARALKRLGAAMERGYAAELDRRAIESDAFLRRSIGR